jgi:phage terminase large subunit-like protein
MIPEVDSTTGAYILKSDAKAIEDGCWFDSEAADKVCTFFSKFLRHSKGEFAGKPFELLPWQRALIRTIYGWKRADATRRFRHVYLECPKKNGKSSLAAAISVVMLVMDGEAGAEVYLAANDREQAGIVYREAASMIRSSATLSQHCIPIDSRKTISFPKTNSYIKALSADGYRQEGINANCIIYDETHSYKSRELWDTLAYATRARRQPLQIVITTAGVYQPEQIGWLEHERAVSISQSGEDWTYLPLIFAPEEDDDWHDPAVWQKVNPSIGHTFTIDSFKEDYNKAIASPREENRFKRYSLSIWTSTQTSWITQQDWDGCSGDIDWQDIAEVNKGKLAYAGLDLSRRSDLTAITLLFPKDDNSSYDVLTEAWIPQDCAAEKERRDRVPYDMWTQAGIVHQTPGNVIDYAYVCKRIIELCKTYDIREIAYDRAMSTYLMGLFQEYGVIDGCDTTFIEFAQTFMQMTEPIKEWEMLIKAKRLRHGGNPLLTWQQHNAVLTENKGGQLLLSKASSNQRVDSIVCGVMALGRIQVAEPVEETPQYVQFI